MTAVAARECDPHAGLYPAYLQRVLMRASSVIDSQWPLRGSFVEFGMVLGGKEVLFRARVEFFPFVVIVFDGRTGERVCRSIEGDPFEVDGREGRWGSSGDVDE